MHGEQDKDKNANQDEDENANQDVSDASVSDQDIDDVVAIALSDDIFDGKRRILVHILWNGWSKVIY